MRSALGERVRQLKMQKTAQLGIPATSGLVKLAASIGHDAEESNEFSIS